MIPALRAVLRFWWIAVAGAVLGLIGAVALVERQPGPVYAGTETILVNSPNAPYLRTSETQAQATIAPARGKNVKKGAKQMSVRSSTTPPNTQVLVNAANLYPMFLQSDEIRKLRISLYGPAPGRVTATALASSTNTYGVYHPSPLPVISVKTTSRRPQSARKLAVDTVRAFQVWIVNRQKKAGVPATDRIWIEPLRVRVTSSGGKTYGLPAFVLVVVLLAFCGLAILVDRLRPRREATLARVTSRVA
jgi:hypothetical protein